MRPFSILLFSVLLLFGGAPGGAVAEDAPAVPPGYIFVPGGKFLMGEDHEEPRSDSPKHEAVLEPFLIARHEVTNGQYAKFIEAKGYEKDEYWSPEGWKWRTSKEQKERRAPDEWEELRVALEDEFGKHPVVGVTYWEAEAFAKFAGKRLPTEKEWERAARGTDGRAFPWGNEFEHGVRESKPPTERGRTHPVGANPSDVSPVGAFDMGANVSEWTSTTFCPYPGTKYKSRYWGENARRLLKVARGGAWRWIHEPRTPNAYKCRTTYRLIENPPGNGATFIGIRLAANAR